jgi:hypothetical protein
MRAGGFPKAFGSDPISEAPACPAPAEPSRTRAEQLAIPNREHGGSAMSSQRRPGFARCEGRLWPMAKASEGD